MSFSLNASWWERNGEDFWISKPKLNHWMTKSGGVTRIKGRHQRENLKPNDWLIRERVLTLTWLTIFRILSVMGHARALCLGLVLILVQQVLMDNLEDLMIIDSLLKEYDRRATPTNRMGRILKYLIYLYLFVILFLASHFFYFLKWIDKSESI